MKYYVKGNKTLRLTKNAIVPNGYTLITETKYHSINALLSQMSELKGQLATTDYEAIKYAEGWFTEEEYAPIKASREALREQIRAIEAQLEGLLK